MAIHVLVSTYIVGILRLEKAFFAQRILDAETHTCVVCDCMSDKGDRV